jgi:hypothetical protein
MGPAGSRYRRRSRPADGETPPGSVTAPLIPGTDTRNAPRVGTEKEERRGRSAPAAVIAG